MESAITSLRNPRVKAAALLREGKERRRQGRFPIDGARELGRALAAGIELDEFFVCPAECRSAEAQAVCEQVRGNGATPWIEVSADVLGKLAFGERSEGFVGVARIPARRLADLPTLPSDALIAVLEGVEKPGNVGAILRTADAAGVSAVILADPRTDPFNPNTIRASLGTVFSLPLAVASTDETLGWLGERGCRMFAARVDAQQLYTEADLRGPTALVLGSEAAGLSPAWRGAAVTGIRLPMLGVADSLNVSVTAAVLFYEAARQRASV
jgi:TrmH family RNA methyltransferase